MNTHHGAKCQKCSKGTMALVSYSRGYKGNPEQDIKPQKPRLEYECVRCGVRKVSNSHP